MDIQKSAVSVVKGACTILLKDIKSMPEEAFTKSFGPETRTAADIIYEVILVNDHIGMVIRGEDPFEWPDGGWIKAPAEFCTKEIILTSFENSSAKTIATVEAFTGEDLSSTVETEHGQTTKFERCQFMALHMWYHSGQLNFIQTLLGDGKWNWV